jgi:SAM-dependent methyltransferase
MEKMTDQKYLVTSQYKRADNLQARSDFHARFSVNPYPWFEWVFDQINLPAQAQILEIGCGSGELWVQNRTRIPPGWEFIFGDLSYGMLQEAKHNLAFLSDRAVFTALDVQLLRFENNRFDAVIANHVLYHVPNVERGILEAHRVLVPGGTLYAATNGAAHMRQIFDLIAGYPSEEDGWPPARMARLPVLSFSLENGRMLLAKFFEDIELRLYQDALEVTESVPLANYILSLMPEERNALTDAEIAAFTQYLQDVLVKNFGRYHIHKETGVFIARKQA